MNRFLLAVLVIIISLGTHAAKVKYPGKKTYVYRYYLTDKSATTQTLERPGRFLSQKSLERRRRQGLPLDSTDLPVPRAYVRQFQVKNAEVLGTSRWQNTVLVRAADTAVLARLAQLPIVREARCVFIAPDSIDKEEPLGRNVHETFNRWDSVKNDPYGMARLQIEMVGGVQLHEAGFRGKGMTIAVIDGGFQNYNSIPALSHVRILGVHDFVNPCDPNVLDDPMNPENPRSPFQRIDHGTKVFSALAAKAPEVIVGTAPDAAYWLLRSEDSRTEQPVEEDYWTMAAEFADSVGADVINSSLGYSNYDDVLPSYRLRDLDGRTAFVSRSASMLADKGIILCNSAGNSGMGPWKKIGVPADADDIITVGAIDGNGLLAPFSSVGPSQDGRIKPDIVARGSNTTLISGRGTLLHDMGTSFATPVACGMVACLWQALRQKTARQIMDIVRQSANQHEAPNNIYGYGLPDFWQAYQLTIALDAPVGQSPIPTP